MYVGSMAWTWRTRTCRALLRQVRYTVLTKGIPRRGKERALCWKGFGRLSFVLERKYRMDVVETSSETVEDDVVDVDSVGKVGMEDEKEEGEKEKGCFAFMKRKKKEIPELPPVPFHQLYKFATKTELMLISIGIISGIVHGALLPCFTIIFGGLFEDFGTMTDTTTLLNAIADKCVLFVYLGLGSFASGVGMVWLMMGTSQTQGRRIRNKYMRALLSQEIAWYDEVDSAEFANRVTSDVQKIEDGIGDKVASCAQFLAMFITGFIIGFIYGWRLTLVILAVTPLLALSGAFFAKFTTGSVSDLQTAYAKAGAISEEVFGMIKIVASYNLEETMVEKYSLALKGMQHSRETFVNAYKRMDGNLMFALLFGRKLSDALAAGKKRAIFAGLGLGVTMFVLFCSYGLAFWYGNTRVGLDMTAGDVVTVFFSVLIGAFAIGQSAPAMNAISSARGAAPKVFDVIDRESQIDCFSSTGIIGKETTGGIELKDVEFTYRGRPDRLVLNKLSLTIEPGTTVALVGESGCGKSTTIQLLERFYDPISGSVSLDGVDMTEYNVQWLRDQMGFVAQMPTLFAMSIRDNIALGAGHEITEDDKGERIFTKKKVTLDEIKAAAKMANAHGFISQLPDGYDTFLGERGAQLSGGQKQRVAIARALVRNPKVLLLDEATSALDTNSERIVQEAIDRAQEGRTSVVIAHRLSTIRRADKIAVFEAGKIIELGTHEELLQIENGTYKNLVNMQNIVGEDNENGQTEAEREKSIREASRSRRHTYKSSAGTKNDDDKDEEETEEGKKPKPVKGMMLKAFKENRKEWPYILLGSLGALGNAIIWPLFAILFSQIITTLVDPNSKASDVNRWALFFFGVGCLAFVANTLQLAMTGISGELLTNRLRVESFKTLVRQEVGFFDLRENSVGLLTSRLATEATKVQGITGDRLGNIIAAFGTMAIAMVVSFVYCWKLAFIVLATVPIFAAGGALQMKLMSGFAGTLNKLFHQANSIATESIDSIHTVIALGAGQHFLDEYNKQLEIPLKAGKRKSVLAGLAFGFTEFCTFAIWALAFWAGSKFVADNSCDFLSIMVALTALLFGAMNLGQVAALMPDAADASMAASKIFTLIERQSAIDPLSADGERVENVRGEVKYDKLVFRYPARPEATVLKGLSEIAEPGKTLALVGPSGSGKSTLALLVERFYDPQGGSMRLDDKNFKDLNIAMLRDQVGFVTQEPELFNTTVRENIIFGFGKIDGTVVMEEQIIEAAKLANAHSFIMKLPKGYDTEVGPHGRELSGGQRQRIAIARAVVRNPKILVLDEATSALDSESEQVVQDALNKAAEGRTTIVIAHRLSTIQHAHRIAVVVDGNIHERGTHEELLAISGGIYAGLVKTQRL